MKIAILVSIFLAAATSSAMAMPQITDNLLQNCKKCWDDCAYRRTGAVARRRFTGVSQDLQSLLLNDPPPPPPPLFLLLLPLPSPLSSPRVSCLSLSDVQSRAEKRVSTTSACRCGRRATLYMCPGRLSFGARDGPATRAEPREAEGLQAAATRHRRAHSGPALTLLSRCPDSHQYHRRPRSKLGYTWEIGQVGSYRNCGKTSLVGHVS